LLSQMLGVFQGRVDEIHYDTDHIIILDYSNPATIMPHMRDIARTSPFALYANAYKPGGRAGLPGGSGNKAPHARSKKAAMQSLSQSAQDSTAPRLFSFGNTTVLCWGRVYQFAPQTFNAHHVYPVGFACIRQEHDLFLDKVVDVLCEVDAWYDDPTHAAAHAHTDADADPASSSSSSSSASASAEMPPDASSSSSSSSASASSGGEAERAVPQLSVMRTVAEMCRRDLGPPPPPRVAMPARPLTVSSAGAIYGLEYVLRLKGLLDHLCMTKTSLRPVFRITVAWEVGNGKQAVKVYEAKSPSQAWQAALVETVGLPVPAAAAAAAAAAAGVVPVSLPAFPDGAGMVPQGREDFVDIRRPVGGVKAPVSGSGSAVDGVGVGIGGVGGGLVRPSAPDDDTYEEPDEEELELRRTLTELRRAHSRAIRQVHKYMRTPCFLISHSSLTCRVRCLF
jgi:hypothetical protein